MLGYDVFTNLVTNGHLEDKTVANFSWFSVSILKVSQKLSSKLTITVPLESLEAFLKSKQSETYMSSSSQQSTTDVVTKSSSNVKHLIMHSSFFAKRIISYKGPLFD